MRSIKRPINSLSVKWLRQEKTVVNNLFTESENISTFEYGPAHQESGSISYAGVLGSF